MDANGEAMKELYERHISELHDVTNLKAQLAVELPVLRQKARKDGHAEGIASMANDRAQLAAKLLEATTATDEARRSAESHRRSERKLQIAQEELDAEVVRLKRIPEDFNRFLDMTPSGGKPLRLLYNRSVAANQAARGLRAKSVIERHSAPVIVREQRNRDEPEIG